MEKILPGGSSGSCKAGPGAHAGYASSSCCVRWCMKPDVMAGVGMVLLGWAVHAEDCPGVGGMNVGAAGVGCGLSLGAVTALVSSYLAFLLRRLLSPVAIGVVRSKSSLLLASLVLECLSISHSFPSQMLRFGCVGGLDRAESCSLLAAAV